MLLKISRIFFIVLLSLRNQNNAVFLKRSVHSKHQFNSIILLSHNIPILKTKNFCKQKQKDNCKIMNLEDTKKTMIRLGKIENAKAKLVDKQGTVSKIKEALKEAEIEAFNAEFELEILLRKGKFEETFWRFPHLAEKIFDEIDDQSLVQCREVNKWWQKFIDEPKILSMRILEINTCLPKHILLKKIQQNNFKKTIKELENDVVEAINFDSTFKVDRKNITRGSRRQTQLFAKAAELGYLEICQILFAHIENKNPKDKSARADNGFEKETLLHRVARNGHFRIFKLIVETLPDKNPKSDSGITPLHLAANSNFATIEKKNLMDGRGWIPLHRDARNGYFEICKLIIDTLPDKNPKSTNSGTTPLHGAASNNYEICKLIMATLENKNPEDTAGITPLHWAAEYGHIENCKLIMKHLVNKNPKGRPPNDELVGSGWTPLHLASKNGHFEVCKVIMVTLENKNPASEDGCTPLHLAAENGHFEICKLITENLTDRNPEDEYGDTPLKLATEKDHKEICELIKSFLKKAENVSSPPKKRSRKNTP